ncbi:unnamed protein product [Timema podura]|uniref:Uncharacterized protein n=1 Tax=Timema podura TaxID=61482 RepID=A0ABN7PH47_TIMPD|nr:unnamed protein product [Timema podura]
MEKRFIFALSQLTVAKSPRSQLCRKVVRTCTNHADELRMRKVEFRSSVPTFARRESKKHTLSTPDLNLNPDIPVIDSLVQHESDTLGHATTEAVHHMTLLFGLLKKLVRLHEM